MRFPSLLLAGASLFLTGCNTLYVPQHPIYGLMQTNQFNVPAEQKTIAKKELLMSQTVRATAIATLTQDTDLDGPGISADVKFDKGSEFYRIIAPSLKGSQYCAFERTWSPALSFGIDPKGRVCLSDTDDDNNFDQYFVVRGDYAKARFTGSTLSGNPSDVEGALPYTLARSVVGEHAEIGILYDGKYLSIVALDDGKRRRLTDTTYRVRSEELPKTIDFEDTKIELISRDEEKNLTFRVIKGFPTDMPITQRTTVTTVYY